jgi:fatty-acyl-CoA synthase
VTGTIAQVIEWWAHAAAERDAIRFPDDRVTFSELHHWTSRVASELTARGLQRGDRVGIFAANSLDWCIAGLAIMKAGAVLVPLNYRYAPAELESIVEGCTPRFVLADEAGASRAEGQAGFELLPLSLISEHRGGDAMRFEAPFDPDAPIVVAYTSGSTARPKGVVFTSRTVLAYAFEASLNYPELRVGSKAIDVPPLYTGGGTIQLIQFLIMGMTNFIDYDFDALRTLRLLVEEQIEIFGAVPTFFERIAALPEFAEADLSHITFAACGGSRVPIGLLKTWLAKGVVLRQLYGLTEGGGNTTIQPAAEAIEHPEQCGRGGIFTQHRIVRPDGNDCDPGEDGEIWVRGPGMMVGYWGDSESTAATIVENGWLRTGDIGRVDTRGNLTLVDRLKDMIISGGLNIWPIDIEGTIAEFPGVEEVAVIAAKDDRFGETPMAIIYASGTLDPAEIIAHCNARMADYKVPRYIAIETEPLPRLATGKLAKRELKARYADAHERLPRVR